MLHNLGRISTLSEALLTFGICLQYLVVGKLVAFDPRQQYGR